MMVEAITALAVMMPHALRPFMAVGSQMMT